MTEGEALSSIIEIVTDIKESDDSIIKIVKNLKIILLNLKIQNANIKENTGIVPIVDALSKNIEQIEIIINNLVSKDSNKLVESIKVLRSSINDSIKL